MSERIELPTLPARIDRESFVAIHGIVGAVPLVLWALGIVAGFATIVSSVGALFWLGRRRSAAPLVITRAGVDYRDRHLRWSALEVEVHAWTGAQGVGTLVHLRSEGVELRVGSEGCAVTAPSSHSSAVPDVLLAPADLRRFLTRLGVALADEGDVASGPYRVSDAALASRSIALVAPPSATSVREFFRMAPTALASFATHSYTSFFDLWVLGGFAFAYAVFASRIARGESLPTRVLRVRGTRGTLADADPVTDLRDGAVVGRRGGQRALQIEVDGRACRLVCAGPVVPGAPDLGPGPAAFAIAQEDFEWLLDRLALRTKAPAPPPTRAQVATEDDEASETEAASDASVVTRERATDPPAQATVPRPSR